MHLWPTPRILVLPPSSAPWGPQHLFILSRWESRWRAENTACKKRYYSHVFSGARWEFPSNVSVCLFKLPPELWSLEIEASAHLPSRLRVTQRSQDRGVCLYCIRVWSLQSEEEKPVMLSSLCTRGIINQSLPRRESYRPLSFLVSLADINLMKDGGTRLRHDTDLWLLPDVSAGICS